jgi:23S rRNA pseudouridine1911/1915/1917 synthase
MEIKSEQVVPDGYPVSTLRVFAREHFGLHYPSGKGIKKAIEKGLFLVNGEKGKTGTMVHPGDKVQLLDENLEKAPLVDLRLEVIFEDAHFGVIVKPSGLSVHNHQLRNVVNALPGNLSLSDEPDALKRPVPVHRLDSLTSGLLLVAKTRRFQIEIGRMFENGQIGKKYMAVVIGEIIERIEVDLPVDGLPALSLIEPVKCLPSHKFGHLTVVYLYPRTGRTHQLRIHCAHLGHPILGERLYATDLPNLSGKGLFLASIGMEFIHPVTGEKMQFEIEAPAKIRKYLLV